MLMYVVSISILKITTDCFIEGTLVLASIGQVKIEDVKVGDEVWSYNHQTGKKELKKVKHIFRNKTKEWYHLHIFNQNTNKEEKITCTKNHRIYIKNKGYVVANKILEKDKVILYNGIEGLITIIEIECFKMV